jgi:hypothetical protein
MTQTDQARVTDQQHQSHTGDREDEDATELADVEFAHDHRNDQQQRDQQAVPEQVAPVAPCP